MTNRLDKIAPGMSAKLAFALDSILIVFVLFHATSSLRHGIDARLVGAWGVAIFAWFVAAAVLRIYSPCTPRSELHNLQVSGIAVASVTAAVFVANWMADNALARDFRALEFGVLVLSLGTFARLTLVRPLSQRLAGDMFEKVLIVGTGKIARITYKHLLASERPSRCVVGFVRFPHTPPSALEGLPAPVLGTSDEILDILSVEPIDEVYIAGRVTVSGAQMQQVVNACEEVGMPFALPVHHLEFERASVLSSSPACDGYLHYLSTSPKPMQYALKRLLDIVASSIALLILSPLLVGVAVAIKLTSPGPVLFRQVRVGLHGSRFSLLKFRSMVVNAEQMKTQLEAKNEQTGPVFKMKIDPRVSTVGRFIRKYSIDELPQLINILRGDMTIVGPRPALPREVAQYKAWQRRRLSVRPGLTCYWQVSGRNNIGFEDWMRLDLRYIDDWSLTVDVGLILRTFPAVLAGRGAS